VTTNLLTLTPHDKWTTAPTNATHVAAAGAAASFSSFGSEGYRAPRSLQIQRRRNDSYHNCAQYGRAVQSVDWIGVDGSLFAIQKSLNPEIFSLLGHAKIPVNFHGNFFI
jgi:hypothetical protein